jgi:hypothetical protein
MPLDPSIYARFAQPKSVADYDLEAANVQQTQQANALNKLRLQQGLRADQEAQRQLQEQGDMRNALTGLGAGATDDQRVNALLGLGTQSGFTAADTLRKAMTERAKVEAQAQEQRANAAKTLQGVVKSSLGYVYQNPTPQAAMSAIDFAQQQTGVNLDKYRAEVAQLQTPDQFKQWAAGHALDLEKQLPSFTTRNTGQQTQTLAQNPVLGTAGVVNSVQNTASPGELLAAETARRGQNLLDARAREANQTTLTKPFEVTGPDGKPLLVQQDKSGNITPVQGFGPKIGASKPLTEDQSKALLYGTRMQESDKIIGDLADKGTSSPSFAQQLTGGQGLLGRVATSTASPQQQQVDQAQRDFINAVLRRESGAAISPTEFESARLQYFVQPGDSKEVKAQKAANRQTAIKGMLISVPEGMRNSLAPPSAGSGMPSADAIAAELARRAKVGQ